MSRSRWLALAVVVGTAVLGLSFADAWIVHRRELTGEGYRVVVSTVDAWRSVGLPVVGAGVAVGAATGGAALAGLLGWRPAAGIVSVGSVVALGLLGATLLPVMQHGHASRINLSPGWAAFAGTALAVSSVVAAVRVVRPTPWQTLLLAGLALLVLAGGWTGRWVALERGAAPADAWAVGTYTRASTTDRPALTLSVGENSYRIGDRWSGGWESRSWTVVLVDDPACPDVRGTYHAHNVGPSREDLRFVKVTDTCDDGARAEALENGVWELDP